MALRAIQVDVRRVTMDDIVSLITVIIVSGAVFIILWWVIGEDDKR